MGARLHPVKNKRKTNATPSLCMDKIVFVAVPSNIALDANAMVAKV